MMRMPYGINILSGPTGSGKSMTLKVTMEGLDKLHGGSKHILTIEDPTVRSHDAYALRHQHPVRPHRVRKVDDLEGHHGRPR
ncbi:ATPase, T2SS/T4P/T4SS family [Pseudomonas aeruginosa]